MGRNGGVDLRMTLKNDLASERIVRRKEDVEEKTIDKEERRVVVKDEKEIEERKVRRDQDRQKEEERRIRKEEEKRRDQKRRSERSEEGRGKTNDRVGNRDRSKENKAEKIVNGSPIIKDEVKSNPIEESDPKIPSKELTQSNGSVDVKDQTMDDSKDDAKQEPADKKIIKGRDSSSESQEQRKPKRVPAT